MKLATFNVETNAPCAVNLPFLDAQGVVQLDALKTLFEDATRSFGTIHAWENTGMKQARLREGKVLDTVWFAAKRALGAATTAKQVAFKALTEARAAGAPTEALLAKHKQCCQDERNAQGAVNRAVTECNRYDSPLQRPDPKLPIVLSYEAYTNGWLCTPTNTSTTVNVSKPQMSAVCNALMDVLDARLGAYYFSFQNDNDTPLRGRTDPADPATEVDVLQAVGLVNASDLQVIGYNIANQQAFVPTGLRVQPANTVWDAVAGYTFNFFYIGSDATLWIPKRIPILYMDPSDNDYWWGVGQVTIKGQGSAPDTQAAGIIRNDLPSASSLGCYAPSPQGLRACPLAGESRRGGAGGGAMRSDRAEEAEYRWAGSKALGFALGFNVGDPHYLGALGAAAPNGFTATATPRAPVSAAQPAQGRRSVTKVPAQPMDSEIEYYKRFGNSGAGKKNKPKATVPLAVGLAAKAYFNAGGLVKKKKGTWSVTGGGIANSGEALQHANVDRASAGAVMRTEFKAIGFGAQGVDLGSATAFASYVVSPNVDAAVAMAAWTAASANLTLFGGGNADALKPTIRTDQEWCHLYGHGDGGTEELGNFHSGSKHCNTEQLAIECGQRTGKLPNLTVKITAYLLPNTGYAKSKYSDADRALISGSFSAAVDTAVKLKAVITAWAQMTPANFATLLVATPADERVPSTAAWTALQATPKKAAAVREAVLDLLVGVLYLRYPLGFQVRYKIFNQGTKIFDHVFSAQKEAFDYNEFKLLEHTVKRVIAQSNGAGLAFAQTINGRVSQRLATIADEKQRGQATAWAGQYQVP